MELLDDDGRLFGLVNVIDALVVVFVIAILLGGVALVWPTTGESAEGYATLDLGLQPEGVIQEISIGDEIEYGGSEQLMITDKYVYQVDGEPALMVRVRVTGPAVGMTADERQLIEVDGEPLRVGRTLSLRSAAYEVEGNVIRVDETGESLQTSTTNVVIRAEVTQETAAAVAEGDTQVVAGAAVLEVTGFEAYPAPEVANRIVYLGLSLEAIEIGDRLRHGTKSLSIGHELTIDTGRYSIKGTIVRRGNDAIATDETPLLLETTVSSSVADQIQAGDTYDLAGRSIVSVESVTVYPTGDPSTKRVLIGATARMLVEDGTYLFGEREIRTGSTIPIRTTAYSIEPEVVRRGTTDLIGEPDTRTVTAKIENVDPDIADRITVGLTETTRGETTAEVVGVEVSPAMVVLESDDGDIHLREHPRNKDVSLDLELAVRVTDDGTVRFRGEALRTGETVGLELGSLVVEVTILDLE